MDYSQINTNVAALSPMQRRMAGVMVTQRNRNQAESYSQIAARLGWSAADTNAIKAAIPALAAQPQGIASIPLRVTPAMPASKAVAAKVATALQSAKNPTAAARRRELVASMKNRKPFTGTIQVPSANGPMQPVKVTDGRFSIDGRPYLLSKDGRVIINKDLLVVGEVVGGVVRKPSPQFIAQQSYLGAEV